MSPPPAARPRPGIIKLLALLAVPLIGCLLALFVAEIVVRVAGLGSDQLLRPDSVLGVRFIPSKYGLSQGTCYRTDVTINSQGWRSPEFSVEKPAGTYRVLVLGDSFMAAVQVGDQETFSRVLEQRLNAANLGRRVEVINFGVPSWGSDQQYLALREYGLRLKPDLVVVAFYAQNDVAEDDLQLRSSTSTYPKPYFDLRDGKLVELPFVDSTPWWIALGRRVAAPLRIYPMTRDALLTIPSAHRLLFNLGIVGVVPQQGTTAEPAGASLWAWPDRWRRQIGVFEVKPWADWNRAWAITEALLAQTQADAGAAGAAFHLVQLSSPIEVMPRAIASGLVSDPAEIDVDIPSVRVAQIAQRREMPMTNLVPGFRQVIGQSPAAFENLYLGCDGHWNAAGHRLAAELVLPDLASRIAQSVR